LTVLPKYSSRRPLAPVDELFVESKIFSNKQTFKTNRVSRPAMDILFASGMDTVADASIMSSVIALVALVAMEIVLGIDNIVFIAIITSKLPEENQERARRIGLLLALGMRILLLCTISWIMQLKDPIFSLNSLGLPKELLSEEMAQVSVKDIILLFGGLFLMRQSVHEIHEKMENEVDDAHQTGNATTFRGVLIRIAIMDVIFSLDSVITAVGMAEDIWVMILAVVIAVAVMMIFATSVSKFVEDNPTIKMLALSFLILIGVMLVAEGIGSHLDKNYIYFAMAFALIVEFLNMRVRVKVDPKPPKVEAS
jgi:predicted tellurium resistance membrane protein TerC